ncbi:MAG: Synerg-CTERM sorting domain-containing protein [Cloacibacillus sp.]
MKNISEKHIFSAIMITLFATAGIAWAAASGSVNTNQHYTEDTTITATSDDVEGNRKLYGIGSKTADDLTITVASGKTLNVNSTVAISTDRAYAVNNNGTGAINITADAVYNATGTNGAQARTIRKLASGAIVLNGVTQISATTSGKDGLAIGVDARNNGSITLNGSTKINAAGTDGGCPKGIYADAASITFNGAATEVLINGSSTGAQWFNALVTQNIGQVSFNTTETSFTTQNTGNYTAQSISITSPDDYVEFNSDKTTILTTGKSGATGLGGNGSVKFNRGDITIRSVISDGIGKTNAVGVLGNRVTVAEPVGNFNIIVEGSGIYNGDANNANGTAGVYCGEEQSLTVNNPKFNVSVTGGADTSKATADYSDSYGIRTNCGGVVNVSKNTDVAISVKDFIKAAIGVASDNGAYKEGGGHTAPYLNDEVRLLGNVNITAAGTAAGTLDESESKILASKSLAAAAVYGGKLTLGSEGKSVVLNGDVAAADKSSISITAGTVVIKGEKITADNAAIAITAGPSSQIETGSLSSTNNGAITLTLNGDWTDKGTYVVFKSEKPTPAESLKIEYGGAKGLSSARWNEARTEFILTCTGTEQIAPVKPIIPDGAKEEIRPTVAEISYVAKDASESEKTAKITEVAAAMPNVTASELIIDAAGTVVIETETAKKAAEKIILAGETLKTTLPIPVFKAPVEKGKIAASSFVLTGDQLGASVPADVKIMKYLGANKSAFFKYAAAAADFDDKCFTIFTHGTSVIAESIEKGARYDVTVFIKDGGEFDLDGIEGQITDPSAIITTEKTQQPQHNSSSGCNTGFGALALAALALLPTLRVKRNTNRKGW